MVLCISSPILVLSYPSSFSPAFGNMSLASSARPIIHIVCMQAFVAVTLGKYYLNI